MQQPVTTSSATTINSSSSQHSSPHIPASNLTHSSPSNLSQHNPSTHQMTPSNLSNTPTPQPQHPTNLTHSHPPATPTVPSSHPPSPSPTPSSRPSSPSPHQLDQQQQFCLRWNNYQSNLMTVFDQLLQSESFVDVTLACDGHSVKAHKMVLSACSPYFQSLFIENPCQHPIIIMRDIKWCELKAVVEFMYKGEINVSQDQIGPLLKVAESLKIRGLADVNGEPEVTTVNNNNKQYSPSQTQQYSPSQPHHQSQSVTQQYNHHHLNRLHHHSNPHNLSSRPKKRKRRISGTGERDIFHDDCSSREPSRDSRDSRELSRDLAQRDPSLSPQDNCQVRLSPSSSVSSSASPLGSVQGPLGPLVGSLSGSQATGGGMNASQMIASSPQTGISASGGGSLGGSSSGAGVGQSAPGVGGMVGSGVTPTSGAGGVSGGGVSQSGVLLAGLDDLEIKPGIAEMIREEERAKLLESSHAWLGASTSSIADSYQYQLQSMWQKCWSQNTQHHSLVHNLRFRERGPLKSWRPETMAEAIFSVLKEGLSLSQAARKYDIPYPTFVLYANRVHNMLGPSADGGADLRPKGRGRPQRILLGVWPDEHIRGVIRAVVFRDSASSPSPHHHQQHHLNNLNSQHQMQIKDDMHLYPTTAAAAARLMHHDGLSIQSFPVASDVSPGMAAAVAAVAQGLRQQMCSIASIAHHAGHPPVSPSESPLDTPISSPLALDLENNRSSTGNMAANLTTNISNNMNNSMAGSRSDMFHHHHHNHDDVVDDVEMAVEDLVVPQLKLEPVCRGE